MRKLASLSSPPDSCPEMGATLDWLKENGFGSVYADLRRVEGLGVDEYPYWEKRLRPKNDAAFPLDLQFADDSSLGCGIPSRSNASIAFIWALEPAQRPVELLWWVVEEISSGRTVILSGGGLTATTLEVDPPSFAIALSKFGAKELHQIGRKRDRLIILKRMVHSEPWCPSVKN